MNHLKILGIDPGIKKIGWAIGEEKKDFKLIDFNCLKINSPEKNFLVLFDFFEKIVKKYQPKTLVIEKIIFSKNKKTAIQIAKVIGIIEFLAQKHNLEIIEITPKELKKMIAGDGSASKEQIKKILKISFKKDFKKEMPDTLDAISLALAGFYLTKQKKLLKS